MLSPPTIKFIVMLAVIVVSSVVGYVSRRRRWVPESASRPILMVTLVGGYPLASMLPVWALPLQIDDVWVVVQCILLTVSCFLVGLCVGRLHRLARADLGVYSYAAAHSNIGFTMGGFICFCLGGERALAYALLYIAAWNVLMFAGFFPLVSAFAGGKVRFTPGAILRHLLDVRCLPLWGTAAGLTLNLIGVERPDLVARSHVVDVLVVATTAAMFFIIGLTLHVSRMAESAGLHVSLALIKFAASPLLGLMWIAVGGALGFQVVGLQRDVLIIQSTTPMAMFVVVVTGVYGLNVRLATALFVANTVLYLIFVLPVVVFVFGG